MKLEVKLGNQVKIMSFQRLRSLKGKAVLFIPSHNYKGNVVIILLEL